MNNSPKVLILLGSKSDLEAMTGCQTFLEKFQIPYTCEISSAHRNAEKTRLLAESAESKGYRVIIAAAGMSAALPGVVAAHTTLPVIGVPMTGSALNGIDALYSIVQMPAGVPVACVAIGSHGAKNAAILAARIIALNDNTMTEKLKKYQNELAQE